MANDAWLPRGYDVCGIKIQQILSSGDKWQIFSTQGAGNILISLPELADKWVETGFLDESFLSSTEFGPAKFRAFASRKEYMLELVEGGASPGSKADALAFSCALKESRKISGEDSFHDSIYVEQYSRLLPTWTLTPQVADEVVLGTWLSGGVNISTESFRRLRSLVQWMSASDLAEIVTAAGFNVSDNSGQLARRKPADRAKTDEQEEKKNEVTRAKRSGVSGAEKEQGTFSLPGRPQLEMFFNEHVIDIIFNPEKYQALGIDFPSAIVLHGPPGCGKTFAVERLVEFIDWPCFSIDSNSVGSPYIHETSKKISEVFDKAIDGAPSVLVIDEMESYLSDRNSGGRSGLHHVEEVAEFLRRIPEAIKSRVLIIAMTNMIEMIDPAILRRGRFDHVIEVGMPSRTEVSALLDHLIGKLPKSEELNLDGLLDVLTGKPLSDAAFVVREAARMAARAGKTSLDQESIAAAIKILPENKGSKGKPIGFVPRS